MLVQVLLTLKETDRAPLYALAVHHDYELAAAAMNLAPGTFRAAGRRLHHVDYQAEYASDPEADIAEAVQHGFTRDKVSNIIFHIASSVSVPIERLVFPSLGAGIPGVVCIDSERRAVFPQETHPVLAEIVVDLLNDFNTGRRSPLQFEDRDIMEDNRGIIDEVTR